MRSTETGWEESPESVTSAVSVVGGNDRPYAKRYVVSSPFGLTIPWSVADSCVIPVAADTDAYGFALATVVNVVLLPVAVPWGFWVTKRA